MLVTNYKVIFHKPNKNNKKREDNKLIYLSNQTPYKALSCHGLSVRYTLCKKKKITSGLFAMNGTIRGRAGLVRSMLRPAPVATEPHRRAPWRSGP
jgi:hypothetical protein